MRLSPHGTHGIVSADSAIPRTVPKAYIKTAKGILEYHRQFLYFGNKVIDKEAMLENLRILSVYLDKIGIN